MSRVYNNTDDNATLFYGANGNDYVVSHQQSAVITVAEAIGRSPRGVYYRHDLEVWALRIKRKKDKEAVRSFFNKV